jgi:hypothetical protein
VTLLTELTRLKTSLQELGTVLTNLTVAKVTKMPAVYGKQRIISVLTGVRHWTYSEHVQSSPRPNRIPLMMMMMIIIIIMSTG